MERIFYKSDIQDAYTGLPIYIFDTSYLPSPDLINYDEFIPTLMTAVPQHNYVLIMFSCGLNKISWMWGIKFLKTFLSSDSEVNNLDNLVKIITVHNSWFVKSITQIVTNYNLTKKNLSSFNKLFESLNNTPFSDFLKFPNLIINCSSLSELTNYVDIRKLKLSLNIYKHDLLLEPKISFQFPIEKLIHSKVKFDEAKFPTFYNHFYQIFNILHLYGNKVELIFHKPGNKVNTDILYQSISRNQLIWINDWDLYCISTTFKKMLMDLPHPLISFKVIELPIKDDLNSTLYQFQHLLQHYTKFDSNYGMVLFQLLSLCERIIANTSVTKHTSMSLAKSLCYCLSQEFILLQNKDNAKVIIRFVKNLLDHWPQIKLGYQARFKTVDEIIKHDTDKINDSYELLYDINIVDHDDETRIMFNTSNILNNISNLRPDTVYSESNKPPLPKRPSVARESSISQDLPVSRGDVFTAPATAATLFTSGNSSSIFTPVSSPNKNGPPTPESISPPHSHSKDALGSKKTTPKTGAKPLVNLTKVQHSRKLSDVSNYQPQVQYPPQKYKFERPSKRSVSTDSENSVSSSTPGVTALSSKISMEFGSSPYKKPVIRGRKVGELAKLFEERTKGLELLQGM